MQVLCPYIQEILYFHGCHGLRKSTLLPPKNSIQGEDQPTDEFHFWETTTTTSPSTSSLSPQTVSNTLPIPKTATLLVPENNSSDIPSVAPDSTTHGNKEVIVYSINNLKKKLEKPPQKEQEDSTPLEHNQELDQDPSNPSSQPGNTINDLDSNNDFDDLDQLIAIRKRVRSSTQHPISNHVSYEKLSQNFKVFITSLKDVRIPSNIQDALQQPEWKIVV